MADNPLKTDDLTSPSMDAGTVELQNPEIVQPSGLFKRGWRGYWHRKRWTLPLTILAVLVLGLVIPGSRYPLLGLVIKKPALVTITDAAKGRVLSSVRLQLDGKTFETNRAGQVATSLKFGPHKLEVSKRYYASARRTVWVGMTGRPRLSIPLRATGQQVSLSVVDKLSGQPVSNALVSVAGTTGRTSNQGGLTLALPAGRHTLAASIKADGYNAAAVSFGIPAAKTTLSLTPAGRIYFLTQKTGRFDVVSANLDGSGQTTLLKGTGKETAATTMLASPDWKYLALLARRDSSQPELYVINTTTGNLSVIDASDASFRLIGWQVDYLAYLTDSRAITTSQSGHATLKTYNATRNKLINIDSSDATGKRPDVNMSEYIDDVTFLGPKLVYTKDWLGYKSLDYTSTLTNSLVWVNPDGTGHQVIKSYDEKGGSVDFQLSHPASSYTPDKLLLTVGTNQRLSFSYLHLDGSISPASGVTYSSAQDPGVNYLLSPSGRQTFWEDEASGSLYISDTNAAASQTLTNDDGYQPYGWYGDKYLLLASEDFQPNHTGTLYLRPVGSSKIFTIGSFYQPDPVHYIYGSYGGL